jgi:deoxyribonuclease (pyrimidine dimer)
MTRINVSINPKKLTDRHLIAEHREIKRIPNMVKSGRAKIIDIPKKFSLGKGHVKFFYNKLGYLKDRYEDLYKECKYRGFNVMYYGSAWDNIPNHLMNNYIPIEEDRIIIEQRIAEKLAQKHER